MQKCEYIQLKSPSFWGKSMTQARLNTAGNQGFKLVTATNSVFMGISWYTTYTLERLIIDGTEFNLLQTNEMTQNQTLKKPQLPEL